MNPPFDMMAELSAEAEMTRQFQQLITALLSIDTTRLEQKIAFADSGRLQAVIEACAAAAAAQPGPRGFVLSNPQDLYYAVQDCKFFLFCIREYREHLARQEAERKRNRVSV